MKNDHIVSYVGEVNRNLRRKEKVFTTFFENFLKHAPTFGENTRGAHIFEIVCLFYRLIIHNTWHGICKTIVQKLPKTNMKK